MEITVANLVIIVAIGVVAPLVARLIGTWLAIPVVVFEIVLGIVAGPDVLGWVTIDEHTDLIANFGLAMLFFLAGSEIDFRKIRGRPSRTALAGWLVSLGAALGLSFLIAQHPGAAVFIAIALTSTALGTILPMLRDAGDLRSPFGIAVTAVGAVGEFAPLIAISIFLSGRTPLQGSLVLLGFAVVAGLAIWGASRGVGAEFERLVRASLHTSGQFAVRLFMVVTLALVGVSIALGLDMLLGAFTAGVLYRLLINGLGEHESEVIESKLEAVAFGVFVPVFFIYTGVTFDVEALLSSPRSLALLPVFLLALLLLRGLPSLLSLPRGSNWLDRGAMALYGATGLPIIVAVTAIGVDQGDLGTDVAAALVGAGMLSVLIFPLVALALRRRSSDAPTTGPDDVDVPIVA
ncbi:cation:proton antiporter [Agromyces sp. SYSU T00194]|uniref:cation:proton antiporter n=1 Tax=Agromyces chitinivorans TaxID=3158560 RepID=UPI0033993667